MAKLKLNLTYEKPSLLNVPVTRNIKRCVEATLDAEGVTALCEINILLTDDIGCMTTLPGGYARQLRERGILATPFSRLRGDADSEFNNRNHRKITVIDGHIAYTGGINLADEYINAYEKHEKKREVPKAPKKFDGKYRRKS